MCSLQVKRTKCKCCQELKGQEFSWEGDPCFSQGRQGNAVHATDQVSRHALH